MMSIIRKFMPEVVYGGTDGAITTFAVTAGVVGAGLSPAVILILGFASLMADGFSMAASNYLSTRADPDQTEKPIHTALATFLPFILIGSIPVLPYIGLQFAPGVFGQTFLISSIFTAIAFIIIGTSKASVTGESKIASSLETLLIGGFAAVIAYTVGFLLQTLI